MSFITSDFLLHGDTARRLYQTYAEHQPIIDYHCHLPVADLASNRRFRNLHEIWLEGDHYKWRAMRANGVPERYCTGDADPYEKFLAWARTVPFTLRNPLYHWTHLELARIGPIRQQIAGATTRVFALLDVVPSVADSPAAVRKLSREFIEHYRNDEAGWQTVLPLSVVVAQRATRPAAADVTLFKAMGMGIADLALGIEVYRRAIEQGAGRALPHPRPVSPRLQ